MINFRIFELLILKKMTPIITLIGQKHTGKSTLYNQLINNFKNKTKNYQLSTRDYKVSQIKILNILIKIVDTAGFKSKPNILEKKFIEQTRCSIKASDIIFFITNSTAGLDDEDKKITKLLYNKKIFFVFNKTEIQDTFIKVSHLYKLGVTEINYVSFINKKSILRFFKKKVIPWIMSNTNYFTRQHECKQKNLKKIVVFKENFKHTNNDSKNQIVVSIIGKPNVGKSTLINSLIHTNRVVTDDYPGTTQDSISIPVIDFLGHQYTFIDTAGVRKIKTINKFSEKNAISQTFSSIRKSNIVLLMIDANECICNQDIDLLNYSVNIGIPVIIVINKCDMISSIKKKELKKIVLFYLRRLHNIKIHCISALLNQGSSALFSSIQQTYASKLEVIKASKLTKILHMLIKKNPPPLTHQKRIKLKFAHPSGKNPIKIVIYGNQTQKIPGYYTNYLSNNFIKELNLIGSTIKIIFKNSVNPYI